MPILKKPLNFKDGFISPPVPRDKTGEGCPDLQNFALTPDGGALMPFPGFWRTYPYNLLQGVPTTKKLRVVSFPAQALLTNGGRGLGVVDEVTGHILGLAFHPGGVPLDMNVPADRVPTVLGRLNRQGAQDYPTIITIQGTTFIFVPFDEPYVFDGVELRKAGLRAPQMAPTAIPSVELAEDGTPDYVSVFPDPWQAWNNVRAGVEIASNGAHGETHFHFGDTANRDPGLIAWQTTNVTLAQGTCLVNMNITDFGLRVPITIEFDSTVDFTGGPANKRYVMFITNYTGDHIGRITLDADFEAKSVGIYLQAGASIPSDPPGSGGSGGGEKPFWGSWTIK